jgi:O-antigen ligase
MHGPDHLSKITGWAALALAAMPMLGPRNVVALIAVWSLLTVVHALAYRRAPDRSAWRWTLLLSAPFLLMVLDLPRAPDLEGGWRIVERSVSLALFPVGFLLLRSPLDQRMRHLAIDVFSVSALAVSLWTNGRMLLDPALLHVIDASAFGDRYRAAFSRINGIHPPFAAYFFVCAALFQSLSALRTTQHRPWRIAAAVTLVISAALVGSRMPLAAFALAMVAVPNLLSGTSAPVRRWSWAMLPICAVLAIVVPTSRQRIQEVFTPSGEGIHHSVGIRTPILQCSIRLLEDHWILGTGQARVQPALDGCYTAYDDPALLDGSYSTHCQPLHWWIAFGLPGLAAFLLLFGISIRSALQHMDGEHLGLLLIVGLCCLTENVLARQWGVVFFALFNTLFIAVQRRSERP